MPEIIALDSGALDSLLFSVGLLGILLLVGFGLRILIPALRRFFIPAALLGGLVGLLLGPHAAGLIPENINSTWGGIAGILIAIVFAPMLLGQELPRAREALKEAAPHVFYSYLTSFLLVAVPALLTFFAFQPLFGTNPLFSTIFEVSWPGGHGTAAGMESAYSALGWSDGSSLGLGGATFALIFGIVSGMIMLNIAARKGQLKSYDPARAGTPSDVLSEQSHESRSRLNKASLDNLAFHFSLIGVAVILGYAMKHFVDMAIEGVPLFPLAMIGGVIVHAAIRPTRLYQLVDKPTLNSIAGIAVDFLIVAAVASLSIPVIVQNWVPFTLTMIICAILSVTMFYVVAPRIFREDWVENGIVNYGTMTGVISVGLMLLRTADPNMKTNAYRGFALRAPFASPFVGGGLITALFPIIAAQYGNLWLGLGCLAICAGLVALAIATGLWRKPSAAAEMPQGPSRRSRL